MESASDAIVTIIVVNMYPGNHIPSKVWVSKKATQITMHFSYVGDLLEFFNWWEVHIPHLLFGLTLDLCKKIFVYC